MNVIGVEEMAVLASLINWRTQVRILPPVLGDIQSKATAGSFLGRRPSVCR